MYKSQATLPSWAMIVLLVALLVFSAPLSSSEIYQDSLGVSVLRSPESTVAPKGDEVVFECELNLAPDRLEWRFRSSSYGHENHYEYLNVSIINIFLKIIASFIGNSLFYYVY